MECPRCGGALSCALSIHTTDDDRPIRTVYQWWRCAGCPVRFTATLVDSRVNIFDDAMQHQGYEVDAAVWEQTRARAAACRTPRDTACGCAVHQHIFSIMPVGGSAWYTHD